MRWTWEYIIRYSYFYRPLRFLNCHQDHHSEGRHTQAHRVCVRVRINYLPTRPEVFTGAGGHVTWVSAASHREHCCF